MINDVWKEYAAHEVTHSVAHYLIALLDLHDRRGYARVSDVAKSLDVTKGSVSVQMKQLKERGFVIEDENRFLKLTDLGESEARKVIENRRIFTEFLTGILNLDKEEAEVDACKVEHLVSEETAQKLLRLSQVLRSDDADTLGFLKKLKNFTLECPTFDECQLCEDQCLMEVEPCFPVVLDDDSSD